MFDFLARLLQRSAIFVLAVLTLAAVVSFAAVSHLVTRFNANQLARGRKLYQQGLADMNAGNATAAIEAFRAALVCDRINPQYQLNLGRALRDTGRLDEAESYLSSLWERTPEDGTINLALARVAAKRGSIDDALRYYHNAMYGVWTSDADVSRRKARIELIEFLLQKNALPQAQSELVALTASLPADPALRLQAAQLLKQAQDYPDSLSEYEKVLQLDHNNSAALSGAGDVAFNSGRYRTAEHYLHEGLIANPNDTNARATLATASLILETDPFIRRISDAERNRRIVAAFTQAGDRLDACAKEKGISLTDISNDDAAPSSALSAKGGKVGDSKNVGAPLLAGVGRSGVARSEIARSGEVPASESDASPLSTLYSSWLAMKPQLPRLRSAAETDLPDTIMDLVFQIEQQTSSDCGQPQGIDQALLLISRDREDADQ
jgi:tetratricopeptide (TPR) repeat protein